MVVRCECGKMLEVPDSYAGKNARCPACKNVFKISPNGQDNVPATIQIQCSYCGKKLTAPASAANKQIKCPGCNATLSVSAATAPKPAAPKTPPSDDIGLELEDMRFAPTPRPAAPQQEDDEKEDADPEYGVAKLKCPNCGAELNQGASFCIQCGTNCATGSKVNTVQPKEVKKEKAEAANKKIAIIIGASVAAAALIGGAVWYLLKKDASIPQTPNAAQSIRENRESESENKNKGYLETVVGAYTETRKTLEDIEVTKAIQEFEALNGRFPRDLEELQLEIPLKKLPEGQKYEYDPQTGVITVVQNGVADK